MIADAAQRFDSDGKLTDETSEELIHQLPENLVDWTAGIEQNHTQRTRSPGNRAKNEILADHVDAGLNLLMAIMKPFVSQDAAPGGYYGPNSCAELKGHPTAVRLAKEAISEFSTINV